MMTLREEAAALQVRRSLPHGLSLVCKPDSNCTDKSCFPLFGSSKAGLQQQTAELEQKLDTVVLVMGGLGLLEAHEDSYQSADDKAAGSLSVCVYMCVSFYGYLCK